jgi:hypothetical protein
MATVVDYSTVVERMTAQGFRSLYYNSGAFGFAPETETEAIGWIGPEDPSIRPQARAWTVRIAEPHAQNLAHAFCLASENILPGNVWLMPKSHWAYELDFGNRDWLPEVLSAVSVEAPSLQKRTNAAALEFSPDNREELEYFVGTLLDKLQGSDFLAAFPAHQTVATLHHHKQIWWETRSLPIAEKLRSLPTSDQSTQSSS